MDEKTTTEEKVNILKALLVCLDSNGILNLIFALIRVVWTDTELKEIPITTKIYREILNQELGSTDHLDDSEIELYMKEVKGYLVLTKGHKDLLLIAYKDFAQLYWVHTEENR